MCAVDARLGDVIIVESRHVGGSRRTAEVVDVLGRGRFRVRWSDGRETIFAPGPDAIVEHRAVTGPMEHHTRLDLAVHEDDEHCHAEVTLVTPTLRMVGHGESRRHPDDPRVPMIGEELAIARALTALADKLQLAARAAIEDHESRPLHLLR